MNKKIKLISLAFAFLAASIPLAACSQNTDGQTSSGAAAGTSNAGETNTVGKVTAVVGNQVTLAVGTLNAGTETGRFRNGNGKSGNSASSAQSSAASSGTSSGTSSSLITLTGETKSFLIPVGLTLSRGQQAGGTSNKDGGMAKSTASGSGAGQMPGGGGNRRNQGTAGGQAPQNGNNASQSTQKTTAAGNTQKTSDFSSIKTGMILQISEESQSGGTTGIVRVSILSE